MNSHERLGVLGGTFDPIHYGHLDAAEAARRACALDTVLLVPSRVPPHRASAPLASEFHRFAMAALASGDREFLVTCDMELQSTGPSFTSVTLERLARTGMAPWQIFFITGADAFAEIASWHDYPAVLDRSHFIVVSRPGYPAPQLKELLPDLRSRMREPPGSEAPADVPAIWLVDAQTRAISSSELRQQITSGQSILGLVPNPVAGYIARHTFYTPSASASDLHGRA